MERDDFFDRGQAQPKTGAFAFGREERLEDARARRFIHADAGVLDAQHEVRIVRVQLLGQHLAARSDGARRYAQHAAARHRVARVEAQVHQYLVQLGLIAAHREPGMDLGFDLNRAVEGVANQRITSLHRPDKSTGECA